MFNQMKLSEELNKTYTPPVSEQVRGDVVLSMQDKLRNNLSLANQQQQMQQQALQQQQIIPDVKTGWGGAK